MACHVPTVFVKKDRAMSPVDGKIFNGDVCRGDPEDPPYQTSV